VTVYGIAAKFGIAMCPYTAIMFDKILGMHLYSSQEEEQTNKQEKKPKKLVYHILATLSMT